MRLPLPGDLLVLAVNRGGELMVPHGSTQLAGGDRLTVVGSLDAIAAARHLFMPGSAPG
jgi:Trk K+ transport system NAD-binding subunit